ncbi:MAG: hypothetical protein A4E53_01392 [Pelotomaculum sp. PtaB.Bin104]|nr:MAG: hypothetical protein A4E53_01392 [Pelotomaculum sp. PtaB.Bin104]
MKKIGITGRSWLKSFHIFFCCAWIGTGLSMLLLGFVKGYTPSGDELYAVNASIKLIDDFIIIPAALGSLFTGLLICWLTNWGFFKFNWIVVKWIITVAQILFGTFFLGKWVNGATAISNTERALALQNQTYLYFREMNNYFGSIQVLLLIVVVFISVFKPWGKKLKKS